MSAVSHNSIEPFIARWKASGAFERGNYQLFLTELSELLPWPCSGPAGAGAARERRGPGPALQVRS